MEIVVILAVIAVLVAYFIFRKPKDVVSSQYIVQPEQYTPEPIGGIPLATPPIESIPEPVLAPAVTTVTFVPEVTQAVAAYVETAVVEVAVVETKVVPKKVAVAKLASTLAAKPKAAAIKAKPPAAKPKKKK